MQNRNEFLGLKFKFPKKRVWENVMLEYNFCPLYLIINKKFAKGKTKMADSLVEQKPSFLLTRPI